MRGFLKYLASVAALSCCFYGCTLSEHSTDGEDEESSSSFFEEDEDPDYDGESSSSIGMRTNISCKGYEKCDYRLITGLRAYTYCDGEFWTYSDPDCIGNKSSSSSAPSYHSSSYVLPEGIKPAGTYDCDECSWGAMRSSILFNGDKPAGEEYGEFMDTRDSAIYGAIIIGSQIWMVNDLEYATKNSLCLNGMEYSDGGCLYSSRYYLWNDAIEACPDGWHLPSIVDYEILIHHVDSSYHPGHPNVSNINYGKASSSIAGRFLKSVVLWNGSYDSGFNADPSGYYDTETGKFESVKNESYYWTSSVDLIDSSSTYYLMLYSDKDSASFGRFTGAALPVRCLKNTPSSSNFPKGVEPSGTYDCTTHECVDTEFLNKSKKYGEFLDTRDNKVYKVVNVGFLTWMAQNLDYTPTDASWGWSGCYIDEADSCAKYGRLYSWAVAMDDENCVNDICSDGVPVRGVCPEGWHLPSISEWESLFIGGTSVAGKKLKSQTGWDEGGNGDDEYGFSIAPGGAYSVKSGNFTSFWTSTGWDDEAIQFTFRGTYDGVPFDGLYDYDGADKKDGYYVRCVKDY